VIIIVFVNILKILDKKQMNETEEGTNDSQNGEYNTNDNLIHI